MSLESHEHKGVAASSSADVPTSKVEDEPAGLEGRDNPRNWSPRYKWLIIGVMSLMALVATTATIACAPASPQIIASFGTSDHIYSTLLVTVWELGEGLCPLLLAPLSEMYGRRIVYNGANIAFVVFTVLTAVSVNLPMLIVMRFLNGMGVATTLLNPAVVGDLFVMEERGLAMALVNLPPLLGPILGPIVGGYVAQKLGWRWVFGVVAIFAGVCAILFMLVFPETYHAVIIWRKIKSTGNNTGQPDELEFSPQPTDAAPPSTDVAAVKVKESLLRPMQLLLFSPVVAILTAYVSMAYAFMYIVLTWLPWVFQVRYKFSQGAVGLTYLGPGVGVAFAVFFCGLTLDRLVQRHKKAGREMLPEHRLPAFAVGSAFTVIGFFLFGWSAEYTEPWIAPIIGSALVAFGLVVMAIGIDTYLVDAFEHHSASALAALGIVRSLATAGLPLVQPALYDNLGLGWSNSVLGFLLVVGVPITLLLMTYGSRLRARSKY